MRRLYLETDTPNTEIGQRYGKRPNWVNMLATKHGWPTRKSLAPKAPPKPRSPATIDGRKVRRPHAHKPKSVKQFILDEKAAEAKRERDLYGKNAGGVAFLRRRNFIVFRSRAGFMVGNTQCTAAELRAIADRERRLAGVAG